MILRIKVFCLNIDNHDHDKLDLNNIHDYDHLDFKRKKENNHDKHFRIEKI